MYTKNLIELASEKAGSQNKLASMLGISSGNLSEMKQARRGVSVHTRAILAAVADYDVKTALIEGVIEELQGGTAIEKEAAEGLIAILKAFPEGKLERAMGIEPTS